VLEIESYVPRVQEQLRKNGYPLFERVDVQTLRMGPSARPEFLSDTKWVFATADKTTAIVIGASFIVLEQTLYRSFEEFIERLETVLRIVQDVLEIALAQRLGFRRVNLLQGSDYLSLDAMVTPGVRGLTPTDFRPECEQRYELWEPTPVGRMMTRLLRPAPETVLPGELASTTLDVRKPTASPENTMTLDIDHFQQETILFDPDMVTASFWQLHDASDLAFRRVVEKRALDHWAQQH
jgi:uncharacterized protein (TIGR04255 family)